MSIFPKNAKLSLAISTPKDKNRGGREQSSSSDELASGSAPLVWCFVTGLSTSDSEKKHNQAIVRTHTSRRQWAKEQTNATINRTRSTTSQPGRERKGSTLVSEKPETRQRDRPSSSYEQHRRHSSSPTSFAVSGATTSFDPFETYPSELSGKLVDRLMPTILSQTSRLLPPLGLGDDTERWGIFTTAWLQASIHDRAMFHAALFACLFNSRIATANPVQSREELLCYHIAVQEINQKLVELELTVTENIIQSVCCLAFHEDDQGNTPSKSPRQGPFRTLQLLDLYGGTVSPAGLHTRGMTMMVRAKGGPEQLKFDGLPQLVCYVDIMCANRGPRRPVFEFISRFKSPADELHRAAAGHFSLVPLGTGFSSLDQVLAPQRVAPLKMVLRRMCEYTMVLDRFPAASHLSVSLGMLADMRNYVQHSLLSLCLRKTMDKRTTPLPLLDMCHAAAMVYSWIVIFPAPVHAIPFHHAATQIKTFMDLDEMYEYWRQTPDLMLWILVMGALASIGSTLERGYIILLGRALARLKVDTWHGLKSRLERFLWYPGASDVDGQDLWQEILQTGLLL